MSGEPDGEIGGHGDLLIATFGSREQRRHGIRADIGRKPHQRARIVGAHGFGVDRPGDVSTQIVRASSGGDVRSEDSSQEDLRDPPTSVIAGVRWAFARGW